MGTQDTKIPPEKVLAMPLREFFSIEMMDRAVSQWNTGSSWKPQFRIGPQFLKRLHEHASKSGKKMETVGDFLNTYSEEDLIKLRFVSIATLAQLNELFSSFGLSFHTSSRQ
jgi:hypothetical protein